MLPRRPGRLSKPCLPAPWDVLLKGAGSRGKRDFRVCSPNRQAPREDTLHIPEFCKPLREGCSACPAIAPGLELLNIMGLATFPSREGWDHQSVWEGDSFLHHITKPGRTRSPYQEVLIMTCFLVTWGQDTGRERKASPGQGGGGKGVAAPASQRGSVSGRYWGISSAELTALSWKRGEGTEKERVCWKTTTGKPL